MAITQECCEEYWTSPGGSTPTKQQLYGHLPPFTKTIKVRQTRHAEHCWRSKDKLISDILLWTPSHGRAKAGRPARTYIQQLYADTGYSLEDLLGTMNDRDGWWKEICVGSMTWWCWCVQSKFSSKGTGNSMTKTFFNLMDQMTISGCWVVNTISAGNTKWYSKLVAMCQSIQPLSNDDLIIYI